MTHFHFVVNSCDVLDLVVIVAGIASPQLPFPLIGMIGVRTVRCPQYRVGLVYHKLFGWYELFHSMHDDISYALTRLLRTPMDLSGSVYVAEVGSQAVPVRKGIFPNLSNSRIFASWMLLEKLGDDNGMIRSSKWCIGCGAYGVWEIGDDKIERIVAAGWLGDMLDKMMCCADFLQAFTGSGNLATL